jgi:hypothetical protein
MNVMIKTIPHPEQRYITTGDYWEDKNGTIQIRVSNMGDWRYEILVAVHELVELIIMRHRGIMLSKSDEFDIPYEETRKGPLKLESSNTYSRRAPCGCYVTKNSEPGDDPHAPYYREHQLASGIERMLAALLGVNWEAYELANEHVA